MGRVLRLLFVVGFFAASAMLIPGADAHHSISFTECEEAEETPEPEPDPEPQPPDPEEDPDATPTPTPAPTPGGPPSSSSCVPDSGAVLRGTHELRFSVEAPGTARGPIQRVEAYILSEDEEIPNPNDGQPVLSESYPVRDEAPREATYTVTWNTRELSPLNGAYTFEVRAWAYDLAAGEDVHETSARRDYLLVDNAPRTPSAPRIAVVTESSVSVEWSVAPELDVIGYTLYRASTATSTNTPAPEEFEPLLTTTKRAVRDDVPGPGAYWYKVQVTRRSVVTPSEGIRSRLSAASTAGVVAGLQATPRPEGEPPPPPPPRRPIVIPRASASRLPPVPEAPFSAYLPFDVPERRTSPTQEREPDPDPGEDPRTGVLPVAVGAFLLSAALAIGRMPY